MPVPTLEAEKLPASQSAVNEPDSGVYGEGAALTRLKQALPAMGPTPPPTPGPNLPPISQQPLEPPPSGPEGRPPGPTIPGVPSVLLHPTQQPDVPSSTPLNPGAPQTAAVTDVQRRLQILDLLAESPGVSDTTRQWAVMVRRALVGA